MTGRGLRCPAALLLLCVLVGCNAGQPEQRAAASPAPAASSSQAPPATAIPEPAPTAAPNAASTTAPVAVDVPAAATGSHTAPLLAEASKGRRCSSDADCAVKDVGSCCGYRPQCLNKDTPTFPEQVKAQCAKEGRVSTCGMLAISGCQCVSGQCANVLLSDDSMTAPAELK